MHLRANAFSVMMVCLLTADFGLAAPPQEAYPFVGQVTGDQVNIRAGQSANFERVCQMGKDEEALVIEKQFSWYKIQLPPQAKCYIHKEYVQFLGQNAGGIMADQVNIRAGAGIHFTVLGQVNKGEVVTIEEELDDWYRIRPTPETYGWVTDDFITFKSSDTSAFKLSSAKQTFEIPSDVKEEASDAAADEPQESKVVTSAKVDPVPVTKQVAVQSPVIDAPKKSTPSVTTTAKAKVVSKKSVDSAETIQKIEKEKPQTKTPQAATPTPAVKKFDIPENGILSVVGYVEPFEEKGEDGIFYKIVEEGETVCYIQGPNQMLGRFLHQKVAVEGAVIEKLLSKHNFPVLTLSKIRLMI